MTNRPTFTLLVITAVMLSTVALGAAFAAPAAAQTIDSSERTMDTEAEPGDTLEIQVEVVVSQGDTGDLTIEEQFDPNVEEASIAELTLNGGSHDADIQDAGDGGVFVWFEDEEFEDGDTIVLAYEVTIPDDAGGEVVIDGYAFFGEEVTTSGPDTITVQGDGNESGSDGDDEDAGDDTDESDGDDGTGSDGDEEETDDGETDSGADDETDGEATGDGEEEAGGDDRESDDVEDADETDSGDDASDEDDDANDDAEEPSNDDDSGDSLLLYALLGGGLLAVLLGGGYAYTRRDKTRDPQSPF